MFQVWDSSGILRNHKGKPLYYSIIMEQYRTRKKKNEIVFSGRNINFSYPNSNNGIHNFSFDLRNGELIAIMGGSGSGKTTLVSILNGNIKPSSGTITINGHSIDEPETKALIGFVPQDDLLIEELTVYQNLQMGAYTRRDKDEFRETLDMVYRRFPRLEERKTQVAGTLSGGEQQMLAMGRALMSHPRIILMDEPSMGLSPLLVTEVFDIIREISASGTTVLLVEQNAKKALSIADRAYVLETGNIALQGNAQELMNNEAVQKAYLGEA